jgi:polyketide cyclase/dehydrase/lipid transport protein
MRLLARLIAAAAVVTAAIAGVGYLLPREVRVTRDIIIEAPPERVFPHVNSMRRAAEWASWLEFDPTMQRSYAGPRQGVGSRVAWTSSDRSLGSGRQEIVASVPNWHVETVLELGTRTANSWYDLAPTDGGTRVTWGLRVDMGMSPAGRYLGLRLKRRIVAHYEKGLLRLKQLIEAE